MRMTEKKVIPISSFMPMSVCPYFTYVCTSVQRHPLSKSNTFDRNFMKLGHIVK